MPIAAFVPTLNTSRPLPFVNEVSCVHPVDHPLRQHIITISHDHANDEERKEEQALAATSSLVPDEEASIEAENTITEGRIGKTTSTASRTRCPWRRRATPVSENHLPGRSPMSDTKIESIRSQSSSLSRKKCAWHLKDISLEENVGSAFTSRA